ncbi:MAG: ribosome silencing factor [Pseudomonadota bacterium]|jgi:ribosome-associated protein
MPFMTETSAKRDVQKLQRAIVDGLEDVKAQDIVVFNTEQMSPLFERVVIASGTSNRQTKALAASVRDKVRDAGFPKPRIEGEDNGEWIIVDCGAAVVHVMQPAIRQYYHLEEIWGDKPVRLKHGADKVARPLTVKKTEAPASNPKARSKKPAAKKTVARQPAAKKSVAQKPAAKKPAAKKSAPSGASAKTVQRKPSARKA